MIHLREYAPNSTRNNGLFRAVHEYLRANGRTDSTRLYSHFGRPATNMISVMHALARRGKVRKVGSVRANRTRANLWEAV